MHYSEDPAMVRVDFFKESGKWYTTEAIKWLHWGSRSEDGTKIYLIHDVFAESLRAALGPRLREMTAVCLEPYFEHGHPIMLRGWQS